MSIDIVRNSNSRFDIHSARNTPISDPTERHSDFEPRPRFESDPSCLSEKIALNRKVSTEGMSVDKVHLSLKAYKEHFNHSMNKEN
ncbi:hypothetical protein, partial [Salmonella sp. s54836]|uniref:hypothetical protein n=1 Tax=Salmonella sp. s54836 TaxID=3159673 RepID=UPI003980721C